MTLMSLAAEVASLMLILAMALTLVRMMLGPSTADRAVALDMLTTLVAAFAALRALTSGETAYLDATLVLALAGFLTTVAFARYIARRSAGAWREEP